MVPRQPNAHAVQLDGRPAEMRNLPGQEKGDMIATTGPDRACYPAIGWSPRIRTPSTTTLIFFRPLGGYVGVDGAKRRPTWCFWQLPCVELVQVLGPLGKLIEGLRAHCPGARLELAKLCEGAIQRLHCLVRQEFELGEAETELPNRVLQWLEMYFISRPESYWRDVPGYRTPPGSKPAADWRHRLRELAAVAILRRYLWGPAKHLSRQKAGLLRSAAGGVTTTAGSSSKVVGWDLEILDLPLEAVSGDVATWRTVADRLWLLVGDAAGHGWLAYCVIQGARDLFQWLVDQSPEESPVSLCAKLDDHLRECIPGDMFVEGFLGVFSDDGSLAGVGAGHCRLLTWAPGQPSVRMQTYGGPYLGHGATGRDSICLCLKDGKQLTIASDGFYEFPTGEEQLEHGLEHQPPPDVEGSLHEWAVDLVQLAATNHPQHDDIMILTVRFENHLP